MYPSSPPKSVPARVRLPPFPAILTCHHYLINSFNPRSLTFNEWSSHVLYVGGLWVSSISWEEKTTASSVFHSALFGWRVESSSYFARKLKTDFFTYECSFRAFFPHPVPTMLVSIKKCVCQDGQLIHERKTTDCAVGSVCICDSSKKRTRLQRLYFSGRKIPLKPQWKIITCH